MFMDGDFSLFVVYRLDEFYGVSPVLFSSCQGQSLRDREIKRPFMAFDGRWWRKLPEMAALANGKTIRNNDPTVSNVI